MIRLIIILVSIISVFADHPFDETIAACYLEKKGTHEISDCEPLVNDPYFNDQWYLVPKPFWFFNGFVTLDIGILDVWIKHGYFGSGVVVVILDDGLDINHPDLKDNYSPEYGWDYCYDVDTPESRPGSSYEMSMGDFHGTAVAGVIAMGMNNNIGGVGVAPQVTLGAARMFCINSNIPWKLDPIVMATHVMSKNMESIHITVNSRTIPQLASTTPTKIPTDFFNVLKRSVFEGRGGKGTIHVVGAGNDKEYGYNCAFNAFIQNIFTIAVAAITPWGTLTPFSARCTAIMVAAPSSPLPQYFLTTIDRSNYSVNFGRTSAAGSLLGSILSLTFNANSELTWRDVQHLLASTSSRVFIADEDTFVVNGAGFEVSPDFGFGLINALEMVEKAFEFPAVPEMSVCRVGVTPIQDTFTNYETYSQEIEIDGCEGEEEDVVNYLEHVQLKINIAYPSWNTLEIDLVSPNGTIAKLLERQSMLAGNSQNVEWIFDSILTWGESPKGVWKLEIFDPILGTQGNAVYPGLINSLELIFYGTSEKPEHYGD